MTSPTTPTPEQMAWLRAAITRNASFREMASHMKVCVDTVKRILHRNRLMDFDGAKYALAIPTKTWNRPCLRCGCKKTRPKNQYYCDNHKPGQTGLSPEWDDF